MKNGFSLLEVLIALCILGVALLAIEKMECLGLQYNRYALQQTHATLQVASMKVAVQMPDHGAGYWGEWQRNNARFLPEGKGNVQRKGDKWHITLRWRGGSMYG